MAPFLEAKRQDAFVSYNHPSYSWWDKKDTVLFTDFHQELLDQNILGGVEVVNSGRYNIIAHRMAMKYDLTMLCNTDEHYDMYPRYVDSHRPMTLVFAKEKTETGIKEALNAKRTALYFDDFIVARKMEAEALFKAAVKAHVEIRNRNGEPLIVVHLTNTSDLPFHLRMDSHYDIESLPMGQTVLGPQEKQEIILKAIWTYPESTTLDIHVSNILVGPDEALQCSFALPIPKE